MQRRSFLGVMSAGATLGAEEPIPIVDAHIHLFDPHRAEGIPWPEPGSALYRPALPDRYRAIAGPLGVRAAVVVEASPRLEDNQWVLGVAASDSIIAGVVGNLEPGKPEFAKQLERLGRNGLFKGIRWGNLWGRDLGADLGRREFVAGLRLLSRSKLALDSANPNPALIAAIVRLTDLVPDLRVIVDHLPQMVVPEGAAGRQVREHLRALGARPQVFCKISEVLRRVNGGIPRNLGYYREWLDEIYLTFGQDRVIFGSDWPNADQWLPYAETLGLVKQYFAGKSRAAREDYFHRNAQRAYSLATSPR